MFPAHPPFPDPRFNSFTDPAFFVLKKIIKSKKETLDAKLAEMISLLRARYTIGYAPSNAKRDGTFRKIRLRVSPDVEKREKKLAVSTRRGYVAGGPGER